MTVTTTFKRVARQPENRSPTFEHLKVLRPLVGTWVHEGELKDELAGIGAGTPIRFEYRIRWILNRAVLRWHWTLSSGDEILLTGIEHIGWDAKKGKIVSMMFSTNGSTDTSEWTVEGKSFTSHFTGVQADGSGFGGDVVLKLLGANTMTWQAVNYVVGDAEPVETAIYTFKRKK